MSLGGGNEPSLDTTGPKALLDAVYRKFGAVQSISENYFERWQAPE
jgi:hypothetical protein